MKMIEKLVEQRVELEKRLPDPHFEIGIAARAELAAIQADNARMRETNSRFQKCFVRIAEAFGLTTPLELIANAVDDEENYAEILARMIEEKAALAGAFVALAQLESIHAAVNSVYLDHAIPHRQHGRKGGSTSVTLAPVVSQLAAKIEEVRGEH